jgi:outer membrane protein OmpU
MLAVAIWGAAVEIRCIPLRIPLRRAYLEERGKKMKKFLLATSALVMTSGYAAAEVTFGGSAGFGLQYNDEATVESTLFSFATLTISMRGESDGGLSFGADMAIKVEDNGDLSNDDVTVFVEGAFGRLSFGAVGEADEVRGFSDIGWDGLDVDDVAESTVGDELGDIFGVSLSHNVNYTYSSDAFSVSVSGKLEEDAGGEDGVESYAIGGRYNFGDYYVGLGYAQHSGLTTEDGNIFFGDTGPLGEFIADDFDSSVVSLWGGGSIDAFSFRAMYAIGDHSLDGGSGPVDAIVEATDVETTGFGVSVAYEVDALTISAMYSQTEFDFSAFSDLTEEAYGLGASYDLGGGASVSGGIARIESFDENGFADEETRADIGMTFEF